MRRKISLTETGTGWYLNRPIKVKKKCKEMEIPVEKWTRRKGRLPGEKEYDVCQTLVQEVKRNLYECHDRFVNELEARFDSMSHL